MTTRNLTIGMFCLAAILWGVVGVLAMNQPIDDLEPSPCTLHPCACKEAEMVCEHGAPLCYLKNGKCKCVCVA